MKIYQNCLLCRPHYAWFSILMRESMISRQSGIVASIGPSCKSPNYSGKSWHQREGTSQKQGENGSRAGLQWVCLVASCSLVPCVRPGSEALPRQAPLCMLKAPPLSPLWNYLFPSDSQFASSPF